MKTWPRRTCPCGNYTPPPPAHGGRRKYCSTACAKKAQREQMAAWRAKYLRKSLPSPEEQE